MRKPFFLASLFIGVAFSTYSQQQSEYPSPELNYNPVKLNSEILSPQVSSFQEYNMLPVDLYTGRVDITIPIFEINSGNINVPISISYSTGGIRVDQEATAVGLGWILNAGGSIYRKINDIPDNQIDIGTIIDYDWDVVTDGIPTLQGVGYNRKFDYKKARKDYVINEYPVTSYYDASISESFEGEGYPANFNPGDDAGYNNSNTAGNDITSIHSDFAPDVFFANAPGLKAEFTALRENNNFLSGDFAFNLATFKGDVLNNSGVEVNNILLDIRTQQGFGFYENIDDPSSASYGLEFRRKDYKIRDFYSFSLKNTSGLEFLFDKEDHSESFTYSDNYFDANGYTSRVKIGNKYYQKSINSWNLSKITDAKLSKEVHFIYEEYSKSIPKNNRYMETSYSLDSFQGDFSSSSANNNGCTFLINPNYFIAYSGNTDPFEGPINNVSKHPKLHRINRIEFDEGTVDFIYGFTRIDDTEEKALTEIIVSDYNDNVIKKVRFNYSYFQSKENCTEPECYRLRLDGIDNLLPDDGTVINSYSFEYYYNNKLPKRGSVQQDYLGYYNNNGISGVGNSHTKPKLYYYKNSEEYSILPFPLINKTADAIINGNLNMQPNSYSKSGSLKRINYPTGGFSEFEYENHTFYFDGAEYPAGGNRVKTQTLNDGEGNERNYEYHYIKDGHSSGAINNIPVFGYPKHFTLNPFEIQEFYVYDTNKAHLALTNNSFVGYSRIEEKEVGKGYTIYDFISPAEVPAEFNLRQAVNGLYIPNSYGTGNPGNYSSNCTNKFIQNSSYSTNYFMELDFKRGKLKKKIVRNENNTDLIVEEYLYSTTEFSSLNLINYLRVAPTKRRDYNYTFSHGILNTSQFVYARDLETKKTTTEFFENGNKVTEEFYEYNSEYPFLVGHRVTDSNGEYEKKYYYPFDTEVSSLPNMSNLIFQNRISQPVREENLVNSELTLVKQINYGNFNGKILSKSMSRAKGSDGLEEMSTVIKRDGKGNIIEYLTMDGVHHVIIWGYQDMYPIAKIENVEYSDVESLVSNIQTLSNLDDDRTQGYQGREGDLREVLDGLRNLPVLSGLQITTYTYDPLIGMTSETDFRGNTTYYEYDGFNRLKFVRDNEGNILKANHYNYKN